MSTNKRTYNRSNSRQQQIPLIKPNSLNKQSNEQRLKQIYQSTSNNQSKQKSKHKNHRKYYLPIPNKKILQEQDQPNTTTRYRSYLQNSQLQKQALTYRFNNKNRRYQQEEQNKNNQISHLSQNADFSRKRKIQNSQILTHINRSKPKVSSNVHEDGNELNKSMSKNNHKLNHLENQNLNSKYRASSNYEQNPYNNQMFKIRRSTKKSLSGSISKKPSENSIRQDSKLQNPGTNFGTKSQLSTNITNDLLQQGKNLFKKGNYEQALKIFQKGSQTHPTNLNFAYQMAMIYLKQHNYEEGIKILQKIISSDPTFKKTIYLFSAISAKHLNQFNKGIELAQKGIKLYPNFVDLIFYRAKLYKQIDDLDKSIEDLQKVISLQKDHVQSLYLLAFLYYQKQLTTHAMSSLSSAIYHDQDKNSQYRLQGLKLRAKLYLSQGKIKQARRDILKLKIQKNDPSNCQINYLLGKIQIQQNNISDALINFQKCLRIKNKSTLNSQNQSQTHNRLFTQSGKNNYIVLSLIQICKSKINTKDFYSAYHHINRSKHYSNLISESDPALLKFKYFIEGVIFLMKRKVDDGMKNFTKFKDIQKSNTEKTPKLQKNSKHSLTKKESDKQLNYFYPIFYLYRAFGYFMQNHHDLAIKDYQQYEKFQSLDKYTLYNLFLAKGISRIKTHQFKPAVEFLNKAEQLFAKTQAKKIQPYIYRAMALIQEAKFCNLNENIGKNSSLAPNKKNKSVQMSNSSVLKQSKQDTQIKILQLVFDALKQLDKAYDINDSNSNLLFIRTLIYAYLNKFEQSLDDIIKAISKSQENVPKYFFFRGLLQSTLSNKKQALNDFNIAINLDPNYWNVYLQRSKLYFHTQNYSKALEDLQKVSELKPQQDIEYHKTALYLTNGLYPMAEQTSDLVGDKQSQKYKETKFHIFLRMGKIPQAQQYILPNYDTDRIILQILIGQYGDILVQGKKGQKILKVPPSSKIKYFNIIQYYHMMGIAFFNIGQYQKALDQFTIALKQCHLRDMQKSATTYNHKKGEQNQQESQNSGQKDVNCITYNIFLCHLKLGQLRKAYQIFIRQIIPLNQKMQNSQFMNNFSHLLFQAMKRSNSSTGLQLNQKIVLQNQQDKQQAHIQLFNNIFTDIFGQQVIIQTATFIMRTKLIYLNVEFQKLKQQYSAKLCPQYVLKWLQIKQIQNRPQPPWVKRQSSDQGLVFTDQVQNINIEFQTTQHDQEDDQEQEQQDDQCQQDGEENYEQGQDEQGENYEDNTNKGSSSNVKKKFDPRKFRDQMKLDDQIERKLNKIVNRGAN